MLLKNKKTLLSLLMLTCSSQLVFAQAPGGAGQPSLQSVPAVAAPKGNGRISGTVFDATSQQPVGFATITLADPSGKPLDGALADEKGKFTIPKIGAGKYLLQVSFIGYQTQSINVELKDNNDEVKLSALRISPSATALKEVTVTGMRALMEEKVDRTVYNAEQDATNKGGDATDVLRKVPTLSVDMDGNVTLRGSQNIRVLINNRPSTLAATSIADALKQIPADMIKSVEVITSPSAKYDAEGTGGIINIITKKNNLQGYSLSIDGSAGVRGSNLGLNGSMRKGKMGFNLGGFGRGNYNVRGNFSNKQFTRAEDGQNPGTIHIMRTEQSSSSRNSGLFGHYNFGWDYDINKNNFLSASVRYGLRNSHSLQNDLSTLSYKNDVLNNQRLQDVESRDNSGNVDVDLNYTHSFAKPQQEFSILTQFSRNNRTNDYLFNNLNTETQSVLNREKNLNESFNQEVTLQLDYQNPIGKNQMVEMGAKNIARQVISDYQFFNAASADEPFTLNPDRKRSNVFDYNQNVTAGYLAYTLTTAKMYSLKAGARYEYTSIQAGFEEGKDFTLPSYGTLVPSVNLSKKLGNGNTIKGGYNRRIQRPSLQFLNPNLQGNNRLNLTEGNPNLDPEFTNNFELGYSTFVKGTMLNFSGYARSTNNAIQGFRRVTAGQDSVITNYLNIGQESAYGLSFFTNINISGKLSLNGGTDMYYAVLDNNVPDPALRASNRGLVANFRAFGNYSIGQGWGLQLFSFYRAQRVQLQGRQGGFGIYSLALRKEFNEKRGSLGLGAENFFSNSMKIRSTVNTPNFEQRSVNEMFNLNFKVTFSYRIGKMSMGPQRRRKSVSNDDLKGGGGDGGDGGMQPAGGNQPAGGAQPAGGGQRPAQGPGQQRPGQAPAPQRPGQAPQQVRPGGNN